MKKILSITLTVALLASCAEESIDSIAKRVGAVAAEQCKLMDARVAPDAMPRSFENGKVIDSKLEWWCSGFFPGTCWYAYELTGNEELKAIAEKETMKLNDIEKLNDNHDIGFQINCSFGNAYRLTGDESFCPYIVKGAERLAKRFSPVTGVIMSWNPSARWAYPVIIDNMMNLEILMNGAKLSGNDTLANIANCHAHVTMENHYRPDYSCYHVVNYDPETGSPASKCTHQGYSDDSVWARGQAWGLYGYTMMYRESGIAEYLTQAENIADMLIGRLPEDGIPYWDFDAPDIPNDVKDASAAAIMASALVDLSTMTEDKAKSKKYHDMAMKQIRTLASDEYLAKVGENGNFILMHSTGHRPKGSEVDVPLTYADYYFLEAISKELNHKK